MHNILIRPIKVEDASVSWKWRNDPEIWNFTSSKPDKEITYEIELEWIKNVLKEETSKRFAIIVDETYVGNIQLTCIHGQSAEYHIFIGEKSFWGNGISSIATFEILHYAKEELHLENVYLSVREDNIYAVKSYIKSSFIQVAVEDGWIRMNCDLALLPPPTVSVFVMVYNHEKYLAECLDGILMQKCNFSYNIVAGEDASTDRSREILQEYCKKHPGKFKLILHEKNVGAFANQMSVLSSCNGKYIALCEGDDYWIEPNKLQKQVEFLESNPEYCLVHTNGYIEKNNKLIPWQEWEYVEGDVSETFYYGPSVRTCTALFRSNLLLEYSKLLNQSNIKIIGDWPLFAFYTTKGKFGYIYERMAVYRYNPNSVSSKKSLSNHFKYSLDTIEVKRFLRDYIFTGRIDDLYNESELLKEMNHLYLKYSFDTWNFRKSKKYALETELNSKSRKLAIFTKNYLVFIIGCSYRSIRRIFN